MNNYIQGEGWTQEVPLQHNTEPIKVGPLDWAEVHIDYIEVTIKVNTRTQARYRFPWTEEHLKWEVLEVDLHDDNLLRFKVSKKQSRFFEPGYMTCFTEVYFKDPARGNNGHTEVVQILGYLLKSDFALRI